MKKILFSISFLILFNGAEKSDEIYIDISRDHNDRILVEWSVEVESASRVYLIIKHDGSTQEYELPSLSGQVNLCCYSGDVTIKIIVHRKQAVDQSEDCDALSCVEFVKEEFFNEVISVGTTTTTTTTTIPPTTTIPIPVSEDSDEQATFLKGLRDYFINLYSHVINAYETLTNNQIAYSFIFISSLIFLYIFRNKFDLYLILSRYKYAFLVSLIAILFILLSANRNIYNEESYIANEVIDNSVVTNTTIEIPLVTTPTTQETLITTTSTSTTSTSTTTSTTTTIPTIIGISDDSESVQIIDEEVVDESSLYEGAYSSFAGYELSLIHI